MSKPLNHFVLNIQVLKMDVLLKRTVWFSSI